MYQSNPHLLAGLWNKGWLLQSKYYSCRCQFCHVEVWRHISIIFAYLICIFCFIRQFNKCLQLNKSLEEHLETLLSSSFFSPNMIKTFSVISINNRGCDTIRIHTHCPETRPLTLYTAQLLMSLGSSVVLLQCLD